MNKSDLIDRVADHVGGRAAAAQAVDAFIHHVTDAVSKGEKVAISGFGVFEKTDRAARTGRNPATGAIVKIKKTSVPKFRPGTEFKAVVNGARKLATTTLASVPAAAKKTASVSTTRKVAKNTTGRSAASKTTARPAAKKTTAKAPAKKTTVTKAPAKKTASKKAITRATTKKAASKKAVPARATGAARTSTAGRKSTAARPVPTRTAAKKTARKR